MSLIDYLCEIGTDERLLHANPDGDRNQQLLVGFAALVQCGRQQRNAGQLLGGFWALSLLTISACERFECDNRIQDWFCPKLLTARADPRTAQSQSQPTQCSPSKWSKSCRSPNLVASPGYRSPTRPTHRSWHRTATAPTPSGIRCRRRCRRRGRRSTAPGWTPSCPKVRPFARPRRRSRRIAR